MSLRRISLISLVSITLAGCSSMLSDPVAPPQDVSMSFSYVGTGYQQFQCTADSKGYYWRFIAPEVEIRDAAGRLFARQGADFTFSAPDGSSLKAKINASSTAGPRSQMKDVLFEGTPRGNLKGKLSSFTWVKRTDARGGIPTTACHKGNLGTFLKVPFSANYAFYK